MMLPAAFWAFTRRHGSATVTVVAMAALAVSLYLLLPSAPRWTVAGGVKEVIACDDAVLVTCCRRDGDNFGPVQFWDLNDGRETDHFLAAGKVLHGYTLCKNGRYLVTLLDGKLQGTGLIYWLDLHERRGSHVETPIGWVPATVLFSADGGYFYTLRHDPEAGSVMVSIVETATGQVRHRVEMPTGYYGVTWLTPPSDAPSAGEGPYVLGMYHAKTGASRLISARSGRTTLLDGEIDSQSWGETLPWLVVDRGAHGLWLWDLVEMQWRGRLDGALTLPVSHTRDERLILCRPRGVNTNAPIQLFESRTGALHWQVPVWIPGRTHLSPDSRHFINTCWPRPGRLRLTAYDVRKKAPIWEREWVDEGFLTRFSRDGKMLAMDFHDLHRTEVLDVDSGATRYTLTLPPKVGAESAFTRDGQLLVANEQLWAGTTPFWRNLFDRFSARPDRDFRVMSIYDAPSGQRLFQERTADPVQWHVTSDARRIVMLNKEGIECWDIPAPRPMGWIIGSPMAAGFAVMAVRMSWRRLRSQPAK
jgi:hypothetical protein